jgi:predicted nucleic-acid-binding protein
MTVPMIDTDVILRLVTGDDPVKQAAAAALFKQVRDGSLTIAAPVSVIADAVFVLESAVLYQLGRQQIAQALEPLVQLQHFRVEQRRDVLRALDLYASTKLDFSDALLVAAVERTGAPVLYSYDRDYDRVPSVNRQEP